VKHAESHVIEVGRMWALIAVDWTWAKAVIALAGGVWAWLSPDSSTVLIVQALLMMVALDFLTGVRAALKRGQYLRSRLWNRIADKAVAYGALIVLALAIKKFLPDYPLAVPIVEGILTVICLGELISVLENLHRLGVPVVGRIAKTLRIKVDRMTDDLEGRVNDDRK